MTPAFEPWTKHSDLTRERLSILADVLKRVGKECVAEHKPEEGDTSYGIGTRRYERTKYSIERQADVYPWLTINPETHPLALSFNIGSTPLRYFRGDPEDPPSKQLTHSFGEQYSFEFHNVPPADVVIRLVSEVSKVTLQVERVCLVEIDDDTKEVSAVYEIPFNAAVTNVLPMVAAPVALPPVVPQPKRKQTEEQEGNAVGQ